VIWGHWAVPGVLASSGGKGASLALAPLAPVSPAAFMLVSQLAVSSQLEDSLQLSVKTSIK
jgi:hypothetical protein